MGPLCFLGRDQFALRIHRRLEGVNELVRFAFRFEADDLIGVISKDDQSVGAA